MPDGSREQRRDFSQMQRVFVPLTEKSVEETATHWIIRGIASTPRIDRMGDIVEPKGAKYERMPKLLLYHDSRQPIGNLTSAKATSTGIPFEAAIPKVKEDGNVKTRIEEAVHSVKYDLVSYTSIGFQPLDYEPLNPKEPWGAQRFKTWDWMELSLVTIPANPDAVITGIKSIDDQLRAARKSVKSLAVPGRSTTERPPPGASGKSQPLSSGFFSSQAKGKTMEPLHQQLESLTARREQSVARMAEIDAIEDRPLTDEETAEFAELKEMLPGLDRKITVKTAQLGQAATAVPVDVRSASRAPYGFVRRQDPDDKFEGQSEVRRILCTVQATIDAKKGIFRNPWEVAQERYGKTHPNLVAVMKTGVPGAGSGSGEALAELVAADNRYSGDFIDYLYAQTVFDRLPLREVPANVAIKGLDGTWTGYWVGESKGIPASQGSASSTSTTPLKVAALTVLSNELIRDSSPSAEKIARDGLSEAHRQRIDQTFLSNAAAVSGVSPAGILNGISALGSAGSTAADVLTDIGTLEDTFTTANMNGDLALIMRKTMAGALGRMRSTLGIFDFQGLTRNGGSLLGMTVYTGANVGAGDIIMLDPSAIWKIGDRGVQISVSQEAMIEQDTAPTGATDTPVAASATMVSMFQEESTAIKLVRPINFGKKYSGAVAYVGNATYGDATT